MAGSRKNPHYTKYQMPRHFLYIEMWIEAIEAPGQTMKFNGNGIREWVREMGDWENWRKSGGGKKDTHKRYNGIQIPLEVK